MVTTVIARWVGVLVSVTVALTGLLVVLAHPSSATTSGQPSQGKGYAAAGGDFVGFYTTSAGVKIYCLSPRKALPSSVTMRSATRYSGVSAASSQQLSYALSRWGDAPSAHAAAAESQLVNTIVGNHADVARRAKQLPKSVASLVNRHLALTRRYYGPYVTTVRTPKALLPGQSGQGSVVVTSAAGHRVPGATLLLASTANGSVPRRITTSGAGIGHFTYRATGAGEVHISATAINLPTTRLQVNHPSASQQHMVSWSPVVTSRGTASFQRSPSGFAHVYACSATCNGKPLTTLRACAAATSYASRIAYRYEGKTAYVTFARSTKTTCKSVSITLRDGDQVSAGWQFKTPHGWSRVLTAAGDFVVDCPAAPTVGVTMTYDCTQASVTIALAKAGRAGTWTPLVNPTTHRLVLVINGGQRIYADHGHSAIFTATVACGTHTTYTAQGGVQRANGLYNYGLTATVTTP